MQLKTNYRIKVPNNSIFECPIFYKHVPVSIGKTIFPGDLIQFDLSEFDMILGMN